MNLVPTELNRQLASALRYSLSADRSYIAGKAGFWRFVGLGLIALGIGAATGLVFYGYGLVRSETDHAETLATILSKTLSELELKGEAKGTVQLDPKEIALAPGQTVSLDNSVRLRLDPSAKVVADGEITVQGPSISSPAQARTGGNAPTIVNFTVFKAVPYEKGTVQTGWIFLTSAQRTPTQQYCYYTERLDTPGLNVSFDLGSDEKPEIPKKLPPDFDLMAAFNKCVWFKRDTQ